MEKKNMKTRVIAIVLSVAMIASLAIVLAGCGDNGKTDATTATTATTASTAATTAATNTANSGSNGSAQNSGQSQSSGQAETSFKSGYGINDVYYADISEQAAGQKALSSVNGTFMITNYYAGYYDDSECWCVYIQNTDNTNEEYLCYVSNDFCYVENTDHYTINDAYFANTSEQSAGQLALQALGGEGWRIVSTAQGEYMGVDAWVITCQNDETGSVMVGYVNGNDCYFN